MSTITEIMWDSITENDELHAELTRIMRQEYEPFLTYEKATAVKTFKLESYLREELTSWYEWLPERPIDRLGGEWAMEALRQVDWRHGASLMLAELQGAGEQRGSRHDQATAQTSATAALTREDAARAFAHRRHRQGNSAQAGRGEHRCREGVSARRGRACASARAPLTADIQAGTLVQTRRGETT